MGKYCQQCGKRMTNQAQPECTDCYYKNRRKIETTIIETKNEEGLDLTKKIEIQLWIIIAIFIMGFIAGAKIF